MFAFAAVSTWSGEASAYTWMIRHSYSACSTCHADPSGGELLTQYGRVTADMILRMQYAKRKPDAKEPSPGVLWGLWTPPDALLLGGVERVVRRVRGGRCAAGTGGTGPAAGPALRATRTAQQPAGPRDAPC